MFSIDHGLGTTATDIYSVRIGYLFEQPNTEVVSCLNKADLTMSTNTYFDWVDHLSGIVKSLQTPWS